MGMPVIAAIDVGSNAIRLSVARVGEDNALTSVVSVREAIRLGHDVFTQGVIGEGTMRAAVGAFKKFKRLMDEHGVESVRAVGTSALREARNRKAFIDEVAKESGITITVIPGAEEGRLVYLAVSGKIDLRRRNALLLDIGGGSVELSLVEDGQLLKSQSLKVGTVRMLELLKERQVKAEEFNLLLGEYLHGIKRALRRQMGETQLDMCIGTGGNIEALGELRVKILGKDKKNQISLPEVKKITKTLQGMSYRQRMAELELRPDRADVIVPACVVVQEVLESSGADELRIPEVGLKDGILADMAPSVVLLKRETYRRDLIAFAKNLGKKYKYDRRHGLRVSKHSISLFDQLQPVHQLNHEARLLIELAGLLHDIGQFVSEEGHHKHSHYIIKSEPFIGLTNRHKEMLAMISRYHRKAFPSLSHESFAILPPEDRDAVRKLSGMLRLADALDREHCGAVESFMVTIKGEQLRIALQGGGGMLLEKWALANKTPLFEEVFGLKVIVEGHVQAGKH
jgi:exopolyphosphatase/guanosine-5'-triphosphate,3'-diphosphate pyrophosphatase